MSHQSTYLTKTTFLAISLALGCTSGSSLGCGSSDGEAPGVDTQLLGVYQIDRYEGTGVDGGCDPAQLTDAEGSSHFVLYSFLPNDNPDEARLGGIFCTGVTDCRQRASTGPEPRVGYSFLEGSDETQWRGFGLGKQGSMNDQCLVQVQAHTLTSSGDTINIETRTLETTYPPTFDGNAATCTVRDAVASLSEDSPCKALLVLDATREASL